MSDRQVSRNTNQTSVASSATSVTILAANPDRLGGVIYNDSTAILYILYGGFVAGSAVTAASTTNYTVQIPSQGTHNLISSPYVSTAIIYGIWASANGFARVTELS